MTSGPSRRVVVGALSFFLPALAGCSTSPPAKLYTLAPRAAVRVDRASGTVSVKQVEVAKYLDRPQVVRYSDAYELDTSEFERWGEGLPDMTTRVLVQNLSQRLPGCQVFAASGPLTLSDADLTIEVNISKFDADARGAVTLLAQWVIHRRKSDQFRSQEFHVAASSSDVTGQVAAMSDALGQLASQIAANVAT